MRIANDPFTTWFPHLDLHGETLESAEFQINTFLKDNYTLGKREVVIIHGKGTGTLKKGTQEVLKKSKLVESYYIDPLNDGQTIVRIKENNE